METRVYINVDVEPFCTKLIFPIGVPADGCVGLIFGKFSKTCLKTVAPNETCASAEISTAVNDKVFVRSPSIDGKPLCTLRTAPLPEDLKEDPPPRKRNGKRQQGSVENEPVCETLPSNAEEQNSINDNAPVEASNKDRRKQKNPVKVRIKRSASKVPAGSSTTSVPTRTSERQRKPVRVFFPDSSSGSEGDANEDNDDSSWEGSEQPRLLQAMRMRQTKSAERLSTPRVAPLKIKKLKEQALESAKPPKESSKTHYSCNECGKTFCSKSKYRQHSWCHRPSTDRPYKCKYCAKGFISKAAMERHESSQCGNMPNYCDMCCKGFPTKEALSAHLENHKNYRCENCSQLFLSQRGLRKHYSQTHKKNDKHKAPDKDNVAELHPNEETNKLVEAYSCADIDELVDPTLQGLPEKEVFSCDSCCKSFTDHSELQVHLRQHMEIKTGTDPKDQTYHCSICNKELKSLCTLRVHVQSHNKVRSFECNICQAKYTTPGNLRKHKKIHDTTHTYKCPQCPKEFTHSNYMAKHVKRVHTRDFKFACSYCPKRFQEQKRFQQHLVLMHAGELKEDDYATLTLVKKFHCNQCPFTTYSPKSFRQHEIVHTGKYPYICDQCNKGFTFRFELAKHVRCIHNSQSFRCDRCKRTFTAEDVYKVHKDHHDRGIGITCKECGNLYETQGHYEQHMQTHSKDLPYECVTCKKRFALTRSLNLHRLTHDKHRTPHFRAYNGNRNWDYFCDLCKIYFKYGSSLVAHRVCTHGNGPQTDCPYCDKKFNSKLTLSMHIRTHTKERPMRCTECGKTFRVWNSLKRHVITNHTKDYKLFCALCNKGFVSKSYLKVHLKSAHKAVPSGSGKMKKVQQQQQQPRKPALPRRQLEPLATVPLPPKADRSTMVTHLQPPPTKLPPPVSAPIVNTTHLPPIQQREFFEMQQIQHMEGETYSLMLL
ncbi:zinc finger protein 14-like [Ornithodoros turicata]|uniref:zinc finger protein 14-like n=1 Tax=Ornithodoros turicata TaxID=34597 RepID=UPI0031397E17